MENINFGQFNVLTQSAMESAKELETINTKLFEQLARKNMELFNSAMELNNKFVSALGQTGDVQQIVNEQMKISSEFNNKVVTTMKEAVDILTDSKDDYQSWFENGFSSATKTFQELTPAAAKPARKKAA